MPLIIVVTKVSSLLGSRRLLNLVCCEESCLVNLFLSFRLSSLLGRFVVYGRILWQSLLLTSIPSDRSFRLSFAYEEGRCNCYRLCCLGLKIPSLASWFKFLKQILPLLIEILNYFSFCEFSLFLCCRKGNLSAAADDDLWLVFSTW